jgi:hypothetical protein
MLLLVGYTQAFAHLHRDDFSSLAHAKKSHHIQAPVTKSADIGNDCFEEENKRNLLNIYSKDNTFSVLFYEHVSAEFFFQRFTSRAFSGEHDSRFATLTSPLFRVLRL